MDPPWICTLFCVMTYGLSHDNVYRKQYSQWSSTICWYKIQHVINSVTQRGCPEPCETVLSHAGTITDTSKFIVILCPKRMQHPALTPSNEHREGSSTWGASNIMWGITELSIAYYIQNSNAIGKTKIRLWIHTQKTFHTKLWDIYKEYFTGKYLCDIRTELY